MYGPTLAELQAQSNAPPTIKQHKEYKVLKVLIVLAGVWVIVNWVPRFRDVVMFDLGWGGANHLNGLVLGAAAWVVVGVGIVKSVSKLRAVARIFGWALLEFAVVGAVVFTLVRAFVPQGKCPGRSWRFRRSGHVLCADR
jgi:hypothetical protein